MRGAGRGGGHPLERVLVTPHDDRRLWPGTVPPAAGAPRRAPGSVRRTTSVDLLRPEGLTGPLVVEGRGRDLATGVDDTATVTAEAAVDVVIDFVGGRTVTALDVRPEVVGVDRLVGARVSSGFRRLLADALPDLVAGGSLEHLLLDELTPATLVSGSALARSGAVRLAADGPAARAPVDICAGWAAGSSMFTAIAETGIPLLGWGPPAPSLADPGDPLAWHATEALAPGSMRRRRLIDVGPPSAVRPDDGLTITVRFRDSYWEDDGTETVVHEYGLAATVDPAGWTVLGAGVEPGPLPAPECPRAAASADRLVGRSVTDLRDIVRQEFVGTSTCTHLNDVFRSLADVAHLWSARGARSW